MLHKYQVACRSQKETADEHNAASKVNPCLGIPRPQEEPVEHPVKIKNEPELILKTEELPNLSDTVEKPKTNDDEPQAEGMLHEFRDLGSRKEIANQDKSAPQVNPSVNIPQPQKEPVEVPVQIKHEPELILEPEELSYPAVTVERTITNNDELSAEKFCKMRNVASRKKLYPYKCYICNKVFKTTKDIQDHLLKHVDMIPYQCSTCTNETGQQSKIISLNRLNSHFRMHVSSIKCPKCPRRTSTKGAMKIHIRTNHEQSDKMEYICEPCGKKFLNKRNLHNHELAHKALDEGRYPCSYCDRKLPCKEALIRHERIHTGEKPYQCYKCAKGFRLSWYLIEHISKVHKTEQANDGPILTCEFEGCDFSTTKKRQYYHHKAKHELKVQCSQCPKRFPSKYLLQRHQYVHTGVKNFPCEQCDKSFQSKTRLRKHVASHNNDRPYVCDM